MTDFIYQDGKVTIGESTRQHQEDLLILDKGWNKFRPTRGVGVMDFLADETAPGALESAIRREFERDGMRVGMLENENGKLTIDADYTS